MSDTKTDLRPDYNPSEVTIKEMMVVKNCSYEEALHILRNPTQDKIEDDTDLEKED